jgi:DNA-binding XRE family transcriptional regulator
MDEKKINYGEALRSAIESRGITLSYIAQKLGVSRQSLNNIIERDDVRLSVAVKICDTIGCRIDEIIKRAGQ